MASMSATKKGYPLIPQEEQTCVWMATGLISYKLCDRNYQCELCLFDQAMKNETRGNGEFQESDNGGTEGSFTGDPSVRINGSVFYHPDHCWVKVESRDTVRVGIDDLLTRLISVVKIVILPQVGSSAIQGECCAHIIQEDYILPVISPLCGAVQTVNPRLKNEPELITGDPLGDGWLITIKPKNLESDLKHLLFGKKALLWYQREQRDIIARSDLILKQNPPGVGPTMQDGGIRVGRLQDMLTAMTAKQRAQLLDFSVSRPRDYQRTAPKARG